jgi:Na+-transporting NADH:ubiquinone oxidoreductase subunit NqrF
MGIRKWECEVVSNNNVATFIKEFVVRLPEGEILNFKSGGYIQIDVPKYECSILAKISKLKKNTAKNGISSNFGIEH